MCADGFGETDTGCSACGSATLSWLLLLLLVSIVSVALVVAVVRVIRVDGARKFERREMFATLKVRLASRVVVPVSEAVLSALMFVDWVDSCLRLLCQVLFNFMQVTGFLAAFDLNW